MAQAGHTRRSGAASPADTLALTSRRRIRLVLQLLLILFGVIAFRLVQLQADSEVKFSKEDLGHISQVDIPIPRGEIYDRHGWLMATDRPVSSLWAAPRYIDDPQSVARYLSGRLELPEGEVLSRLSKTDEEGNVKKFVWVKRWLTDSEAQAVGDLSHLSERGLAFKEERVRFYPGKNTAAHVLGFANREGVGCEGIELAYDQYLQSVPGRRVSRVDAKRNILSSLTLEYVEPAGGHHVTTTIDAAIQHSLEMELDAVMERVKAPRAMGMVMDPKTGAILALACRPAFDPNNYSEATPEERKNRALVDVFEPGSSFKIVAASAALEQGFITPETMIDCQNGVLNIGRRRIKDYHRMGVCPFTECFAESSNIAHIKVGAMLGPERMETWMHRFGFGHKTSRDFPGESRGILRPRSQWSGFSMGSLPMGQEVSVTIPQLARAFSVIANGGYVVEPYLVDRVVSRTGDVMYEHEVLPPERILSAKTAQTMRELCHLVVTHGTGSYANIPEYRAGGKTGTAQIANRDGRGYSGKFTAIFAGFAPIADPRVCAVIVVPEPSNSLHFGGYICGPVFKNVVRDALIQMQCPEDPVSGVVKPAETLVADADTVQTPLELNFLDPTPVNVSDTMGLELVSAGEDTIHSGQVLPDFEGMTKREAKALLARIGIQWDPQGTGWVVAQEPSAGTPLEKVALCRLTFANKGA